MTFDDLLPKLAKPAQRALHNAGITTLEQLATSSETQLLELHGIGKNAMTIIVAFMQECGLSFTNQKA